MKWPRTGQSKPPSAAAHGPSLEELSAVVVDWNLADHTVRCVRALLAEGLAPNRVVVVENAPTDHTWQVLSDELSSCVLVRLEHNVGFAAAMNIGARVLPGAAYLLVNNDAFVHRPGTILAMLAALRRERVGIVAPRLLNPDLSLQPTVAPFTTPLVALVRASGLSRLVPNRWQLRVSTHWDHGSSREIQAVIGAVMLVGGDVWEQLGGLHESTFMYSEDIDLCWRAREQGWKTWFACDAEFVHLGGASSERRWSGRERSREIARSEAAMLRRHLSPFQAALTLGVMRAGLTTRAALFSLLGKSDAAASCRGFTDGLRRSSAAPAGGSGSAPAIEVVRPHL